MRVLLVSLAITSALLLLATNAYSQQCSDCDCYHFPIPVKCESCCEAAFGKIASVTNSNIVLDQKEPNGNVVQKTFRLKPDTKKNAELKKGASATVYYHKDGGVVERVDLVEALHSSLLPGNDPDPLPPRVCASVPSNALKIFLGDSLVYTSGDEVTVLQIKGEDVLSLRRTTSGLAIVAKVFSEDGKIVGEIIDNRLYVNPKNFFRIDRPDSHSLVVYDLHQRQVLGVNYINPHSMRVIGIFQLPGRAPVIATENEFLIGRSHFSQSCFGNSRILIAVP